MQLSSLTTEKRNEKTTNLDEMSITELLEIMNEEDAKVTDSIKKVIPQIAKAVEATRKAFRNGGRLIYMGAGTSGRLGVLDAVECPPTFGTSPSEVIGLIAGGDKAFVKAVEGAEDSFELGKNDLIEIGLNKNDVVVGIAASGRTPYVIGGLNYACSINVTTISISCNVNSPIAQIAQIAIEVDNGPEILTGSTRLKAGTSQKLICNMISTATMVGIGKVYGNLMIDVQLTNEKLVDRAKRIIMEATSCNLEIAEIYLNKANNNPKIAIVMILTGLSLEQSHCKIVENEGFIRPVIDSNLKVN